MRMSQISIFLFATALILTSLPHVNAQPSLTGLITGVRTNVSVVGDTVEKKFAIDLYLQIRNSTNEPLIVFGRGFFGNRKISFLSATSSVEDVCTVDWAETMKKYNSRNGYRDFDHYDFLSPRLNTIERLDTPSGEGLVIIEPGSYLEFRESIEVNTGFEALESTLDELIEDARKAHEIRQRNVKPGFRRPLSESFTVGVKKAKSPYLQIEYELSTGSYKKDPNLLRTLQSRWSKFGKMPLNGDNYYLKSDPIVISIPD